MITQLVPILAIILGAIVILIIAKRGQRSHFVCPVCKCSFKVSISTYLSAFHMMGKRNVTCPNCGYRGMLTSVNDDDDK